MMAKYKKKITENNKEEFKMSYTKVQQGTTSGN